MVGVSVILCCYNSAPRLPQTLMHLAFQKVSPEIKWEVIVVDNASTDNTAQVASLNWSKYGPVEVGFRVIKELKSGLSYARNKGINEAVFEYLIFCDDDNWLSENYIETAYNIINENAKIGILGGQSEAQSDVPFPSWFASYESYYAVGKQSIVSGDISVRGYVWGAGMVLRKSVYLNLNTAGFSQLISDRKGDEIISGGDSEICEWFLIAGYKLWYDERLFFTHFIPSSRLTQNYLDSLHSSFLTSYAGLMYYRFYRENKIEKDYKLKYFLRLPSKLFAYLNESDPHKKLDIANELPLFFIKSRNRIYYNIVKAATRFEKMTRANQSRILYDLLTIAYGYLII